MGNMTVIGASKILTNGLEYQNVAFTSSDIVFHYFTADVQLTDEVAPYEICIDRQSDQDGNFNICSRRKGTEEWRYADSVQSDWSEDET
jgi:hypothetical protein